MHEFSIEMRELVGNEVRWRYVGTISRERIDDVADFVREAVSRADVSSPFVHVYRATEMPAPQQQLELQLPLTPVDDAESLARKLKNLAFRLLS